MNRQQQHSLVMIASRTFQTVSRLYCWATVRHVKWPFTELRQYCTIILYTLYTIQLKRGKILQFHECKVYSFCLFVRSREHSEIVEQMKKIRKNSGLKRPILIECLQILICYFKNLISNQVETFLLDYCNMCLLRHDFRI